MVDGLNFLSMEYVDGEDLAALLRRIGRLPEDKAMEFTREICAGLAAAHERGILHRDLKPANIMIDSRGQVRITDFGLAGLVEEIPLSDLGSGTPAYMAPEQKAGKEVSVRSDIYSLGMILHEMFTGYRRDDASDSHPTDYLRSLDPQIERVILQCLAEDPRQRPATTLRVAMSLPGGNAVAAALAAGETPSPEAVAASEEKEGFGLRTALIGVCTVVLCFAGILVAADRFSFFAKFPLDLDPAALEFEARSLLEDLGYAETPAAVKTGWLCCDNNARQQLVGADAAQRDAMLASHRPPIMQFVHRQHRTEFPLLPVTYNSPPNSEPGMIQLRLDPEGRLLELRAVPWTEVPAGTDVPPVTIERLFEAGGFDPARFTPVDPERLPPAMADTRLAWTGIDVADPDTEIRIESAFWQGRPVMFAVSGFPAADGFNYVDVGLIGYVAMGLFVLLAAALLLMWHRARGNRLDWRGGFVLAGFFIATGIPGGLMDWYFMRPGASIEVITIVAVWLFYIAIEPLVRRHWPHSLISWTRLTRGRIRNPLVASHILVGVLTASIFGLFFAAVLTRINPVPPPGAIQNALSGTLGTLPVYLAWSGLGVTSALSFLAIVVLVRLIVKKWWAADLLAVAAFNISGFLVLAIEGISLIMAIAVAYNLAFGLVMISLIRRFGFLAVLSAMVFLAGLSNTPLPAGGWAAPRLIALHAIPVAVAAWALWVIVTSEKRSHTGYA
jgi:serine/threonine-protein kinase